MSVCLSRKILRNDMVLLNGSKESFIAILGAGTNTPTFISHPPEVPQNASRGVTASKEIIEHLRENHCYLYITQHHFNRVNKICCNIDNNQVIIYRWKFCCKNCSPIFFLSRTPGTKFSTRTSLSAAEIILK